MDVGFEDFLRDPERLGSPRFRLGFRVAVMAATWVAPMLIARVPPLTLYGRDTRERALEAMARTYLLRQLPVTLKTVMALSYGADPQVRAALGYPSPEAHS